MKIYRLAKDSAGWVLLWMLLFGAICWGSDQAPPIRMATAFFTMGWGVIPAWLLLRRARQSTTRLGRWFRWPLATAAAVFAVWVVIGSWEAELTPAWNVMQDPDFYRRKMTPIPELSANYEPAPVITTIRRAVETIWDRDGRVIRHEAQETVERR